MLPELRRLNRLREKDTSIYQDLQRSVRRLSVRVRQKRAERTSSSQNETTGTPAPSQEVAAQTGIEENAENRTSTHTAERRISPRDITAAHSRSGFVIRSDTGSNDREQKWRTLNAWY